MEEEKRLEEVQKKKEIKDIFIQMAIVAVGIIFIMVIVSNNIYHAYYNYSHNDYNGYNSYRIHNNLEDTLKIYITEMVIVVIIASIIMYKFVDKIKIIKGIKEKKQIEDNPRKNKLKKIFKGVGGISGGLLMLLFGIMRLKLWNKVVISSY